MTVQYYGPRILGLVRQAAMRGVMKGTESVRNEAIRLITQTEKSGAITRHHGVKHQASAPEEAPATDTGTLLRGITSRYDQQELLGVVNSDAEYSIFLEMGTKNMEERPFMRPALANKRIEIRVGILEEVQRVLAGASQL